MCRHPSWLAMAGTCPFLVQAAWQPHPMGPRVADQSQGNWLGATPRGGNCTANGRGRVHWYNNVRIPGGPCLPTGHGSQHRPYMALSGQPVDSQGETSMELDDEPEVTHGYPPSGFLNPLALPDPRGNPSSSLTHLPGMVPIGEYRPPPGFPPREFSGYRPAPPLLFGGNQPLTSRKTITITSLTAPTMTTASVHFCRTKCFSGRPISSLDYTQNYIRLQPHLEPSALEPGITPRGTAASDPGTNEIPLELSHNRVFLGASSQFIAPAL